MARRKPTATIQEMGARHTSFGYVDYIRIWRHDQKPMAWPEIWTAFTERYPDRWAVQMFPPAADLVDEVNMYHLFILGDAPFGVNIRRRD